MFQKYPMLVFYSKKMQGKYLQLFLESEHVQLIHEGY